MDNPMEGDIKCMWTPRHKKPTNIQKFISKINEKSQQNGASNSTHIQSYDDLHSWSTEHYDEFWENVWRFTDIKHSKPYDQVVDKKAGVVDVPEWFSGARLNFAENLLKHNNERVAIYATSEECPKDGHNYVQYKRHGSQIRKVTFSQLCHDVRTFASAMKRMGVQKGDRVVGYLPNCIEAVEAMLATASIGAIWSSTSPDFGVTGVLDRFSQIEPKLIFSVNAVVYNGKVHDHMCKLTPVVNGLPCLQKVVVIPNVLKEGESVDFTEIKNGCLLDDFLCSSVGPSGDEPDELHFEQLPFSHPLYIMYSSGTTGAPKCMVHSAGGTLIKHLEEHVLQGNLTSDDVMLYYTTTGWMMWNWFVSALAVGAAIVCYDGSPLVPNPNIIWDLIDEIGVTVLGTGAKWLSVLEDKDIKPGSTHKLTSLHSILSTGSPLKPQSFDYVYRDIKADLLLGSITGGTDIIGCFAACCSDLPVHRGEIQCKVLGMAMEAWDETGKSVRGERGELVCTKPFPSQPTHFWNDPEQVKYKKAYFEGFPGVWTHGDFCLVNPQTGGIWMLGRSDGTLNPNGVRFGSAEIYQVVESVKEVVDSLCISQRSGDGSEERVILFLKMAPETPLTPELVKQVKTSIRLNLSARHVPAVIMETTDIPYTISGKKVEVAVKKIISGVDVTHRGAYANPDSLDLYKNIPQLQGF